MPRQGLDPTRVRDAALSLLDAHGAEALSLRALAEHLGVKTPSLYNHIESLPALRAELRAHVLLSLANVLSEAVAAQREPAAKVRELARAYRGFARAHPGWYGETVQAPGRDEPAALRASERILELLLDGLAELGVAAEQQVHAARSLRAALHGFVLLEQGGGFGLPTAAAESFEWMLSAWLAAWPRGTA